jgi:hypothetical protein
MAHHALEIGRSLRVRTGLLYLGVAAGARTMKCLLVRHRNDGRTSFMLYLRDRGEEFGLFANAGVAVAAADNPGACRIFGE